MQPVTFGIVSTGNIAKQFATGLTQSDHGQLVAVASRSQGAADAFAQSFGIDPSHAFDSYDKLLACPDIEAVYIGLPNTMHTEWTIKALNAGKHVLCEKPLAVTLEEAEAMHAAAEANGRVLIEAFMYRTHPQTQAVVQAVRDGAIGKLQLVRTSFCFNLKTKDGNIRFDPSKAGGALMDIGCYCFDFANQLTGRPADSIQLQTIQSESGIDQLTAGVAMHGDVLAVFQCGMTLQAQNQAMLCGTEGSITIDIPWKPLSDDTHTPGYTLHRQTPPKQDGGGQTPPSQFIATPCTKHLYALEADAFAQCVRGQAEPFMPKADSLALCRMLQTARQQAGLPF